MRRKAVESTTVRSIGYDVRSKVLEVEFQSGTVYQHFDVPEAVHEEFLAADSKGKYFNLEIRDEYRFVRVTTARGEEQGLRPPGVVERGTRYVGIGFKPESTTTNGVPHESSMQHLQSDSEADSAAGV